MVAGKRRRNSEGKGSGRRPHSNEVTEQGEGEGGESHELR
jgi:hypothetical protein